MATSHADSSHRSPTAHRFASTLFLSRIFNYVSQLCLPLFQLPEMWTAGPPKRMKQRSSLVSQSWVLPRLLCRLQLQMLLIEKNHAHRLSFTPVYTVLVGRHQKPCPDQKRQPIPSTEHPRSSWSRLAGVGTIPIPEDAGRASHTSPGPKKRAASGVSGTFQVALNCVSSVGFPPTSLAH